MFCIRPAAAIALAVLAFLAGPAAANAQDCPTVHANVAEIGSAGIREGVLCMVNVEREARGLQPLAGDPRLDAAASAHAADMASRNYFSHYSPEGLGFPERAAAQGYGAGGGENIFVGGSTAYGLVAGWLTSEGHCTNILHSAWTDHGFGIERGAASVDEWYSVQVFGSDGHEWSEEVPPVSGCPAVPLGNYPSLGPVVVTTTTSAAACQSAATRLDKAERRLAAVVRRLRAARVSGARPARIARLQRRTAAARKRQRNARSAVDPGCP